MGAETIELDADDRAANAEGVLSAEQRRRLRERRALALLGVLGFVALLAIVCAALGVKLWTPAFAARGELWLWLPVALFWLWLLWPSFGLWRGITRDLAAGQIAVVEGRVQCELSFGIGIVRVPRYHIRLGALAFAVRKSTFFRFQNQADYRLLYVPAARILLGAVALAPEPIVAPPASAPLGEASAALTAPLTEHERAILALIAQGRSNKQIAAELALSVNTVKMYSSQLYRKLGVHRRTEAVARAQQLRIL